MLYNFMDSPTDLYERMRLNIDLNEELGIRIWSFPMRYQPVTLKDRSHVGKRWNRYYLRSFQIMLQATKGVVSGSPSFFLRAYGETPRSLSGCSCYHTPSYFIDSILKMERGVPKERSMNHCAEAFQSLKENELVHLLANPSNGNGMGPATSSGSWRMTKRSTIKSGSYWYSTRWTLGTTSVRKVVSLCLR